MEKLLQILNEIQPDIDFAGHTKLIDDGVLDSFDIVTLVGELNYNYDVQIGVEDLLPENFNSVQAMMNLINQLKLT
ncbi:MAG: phosphopantetheine-binding protein [Bacteroidales bacterium]|jgi:acyl carrier protein|nr:phosphopantetheine-binding protein [Bacteroidales bacterium]